MAARKIEKAFPTILFCLVLGSCVVCVVVVGFFVFCFFSSSVYGYQNLIKKTKQHGLLFVTNTKTISSVN